MDVKIAEAGGAAYRTLLKRIKWLKMTERRLGIRIREKSPAQCWVEIFVSAIESLLVLVFLCHVLTEAELPALSFVMEQPPFSAFCLRHTEYRGKLPRGHICHSARNAPFSSASRSRWKLHYRQDFTLKKKRKEIKWWLIRRDGSLLPSLHFSLYVFFSPVSTEGADVCTEETLRCSEASIRERSCFKDGLILFRFW